MAATTGLPSYLESLARAIDEFDRPKTWRSAYTTYRLAKHDQGTSAELADAACLEAARQLVASHLPELAKGD